MEKFNILKRSNNYYSVEQTQNVQIHKIGSLDMSIYKCISEDYITNEVVITEKQLIHIKKRHPEAYENTVSYIERILEQPDYIIKDKKPNTGLVVKQLVAYEKHMLLVLRICVSCEKEYKNSIITGWEISEARLKNYLKNKQVLYKHE